MSQASLALARLALFILTSINIVYLSEEGENYYVSSNHGHREDKIGIIAGISTELATAGINIVDISQTVMQEYFVMIMLVDLADAIEDSQTVRTKLDEKSK